tara:strand:+ start:2372 stop:3511 length:1140 start_codon:yes stop_codon:yes gene_type:complete
MKKLLTFLILLLLAIPVVYADSDNYEITKVYVNGIQVEDNNKVQVEIDSTAQIIVFLEGTGITTDVKISAWIGGYEYDDVIIYSDVFDVEDGVSYKEYLYLDIPSDLDLDENEYTLHVDIFDSKNKESLTYTLFFEADRHKVLVEDIILSEDTVSADDYLGVKVRLSNEGETDEENLKVTVSINELGISNRVYLDELLSGDQGEASTVYLTIPEDASDGTYEVSVNVEYNNGYSETYDATYLRVDGTSTVYDENVIVSLESVKSLEVGLEEDFKVQVTNLDEDTKTFYLYVEADGMELDYTESVTVSAGSSAELSFTLTPKESGYQSVLVKITSDDGAVSEEVYNTKVEEASNALAIVLSVILLFLVLVLILLYLRKLH